MSATTDLARYAGRWLQVFYRPGKAFADLETGPSTAELMLVLILVMSVVLCAGIVTLPVALDTERALIETEFQSYSDLSVDQKSIILREAVKFDHRQLIGLLIMPASVCFMVAAWSVLGKHCGELIFGKPLPYGKVLPITGYASLVLVPETIVKTSLVLLFDSFNLPIHPGVFLDDADPETLWSLFLPGVDFFGIWFLFLLGLGLAQTFRGSAKLTWLVLGLAWGMWIVIRRTVELLGTVYV
ncbi:MAG: YIP1 family protein [Gemmatimonadetes bacterium]|nr:YIP1 family protein [Gemmatimonadota bacterium]